MSRLPASYLRRQANAISKVPVEFDPGLDKAGCIAASLHLFLDPTPCWRDDPTYNLKR